MLFQNICRIKRFSNIRVYSELSEYIQKYDKYDAKIVDGCCDDLWSRALERENDDLFSLIMPPPNVTGNLHIGHALSFSLQDAIVRSHKMKGYNTVWWPGYDHAGIATQVQVHKYLQKKHGKQFNVNTLNKEQFLDVCKSWSNMKKNNIKNQIKSLALLPTWNKEYYTLDETHSRVVETTFIGLYRKGKIYRDNRIVNWSCQLQSTISDIEINSVEIAGETNVQVPGYTHPIKFGILYKVAYPVEGFQDVSIEVVTTRPETIPADVCLAVCPGDARYSAYIGKRVLNPVTGASIPVIEDIDVDPKFGTGAVKVTPGHSIADFRIGGRHGLPCLNIIDEGGRMKNVDAACVSGMPRFLARDVIINFLQEKKLYKGCNRSHSMKLPLCSRSGDVVEYLIRPQWFFDISDTCDAALNAMENKLIKVQPHGYEGVFNQFFKNKEPWCISRQLKWGHQIPAYYTTENNKPLWFIDKDKESVLLKHPTLKECNLERDSDVLDTWFSSSLLPLTLANYPNILDNYLPSSMLVTGHDIVPLWVCRMMLMSLELTGQLPFKHVLLHGMICDARGRKMSKSVGNVVNPMNLVGNHLFEKFMKENKLISYNQEMEAEVNSEHRLKGSELIKDMGADAVRFALLEHDISGNQINFSLEKVKEGRNFIQKMWQTVRFIFHNWKESLILKDSYTSNLEESWIKILSYDHASFNHIQRWLLFNLVGTLSRSVKANTTFNYHTICINVKQFWWNDLCSVFVEWCKSERDPLKKVQNLEIILLAVDTCLHLIHPIIPQVTEVLWQSIHKHDNPQKMLAYEDYPRENMINSEINGSLEPSSLIINNALVTLSDINYWIQTLKVSRPDLKSGKVVWLSADESGSEQTEEELSLLSRLSFVSIIKNTSSHSSFGIYLAGAKYLNIDQNFCDLKSIESSISKKIKESSSLKSRLLLEKSSNKNLDKVLQKVRIIEEDILRWEEKLMRLKVECNNK